MIHIPGLVDFKDKGDYFPFCKNIGMIAHSWAQKSVHLDRRFVARMLALIVVQLLCTPVVGREDIHCPNSDPLQVPHEWYQSGDLVISGIMSQMLYAPFKHSFRKHPSKDFFYASL